MALGRGPWNRSGPTVLRGHESYVYSVEFSPHGDLVASAGFRGLDRTVRLWDPIQGTQVGVIADATAGSWAVFSSDGRKLVLRPQESGHPRAVDLLTGQMASHDHSEEGSPEGFMRDAPGEAWLECFREQVGSADQARVGQTVFSPGDDLVVSRIDEDAILVRRGIGGPQLARLEGAELDRNPDLSPDGRHVAAGSTDHAVYVWDWRQSGEPMRLRGHTGEVYDVRFSPDGKRLASGGNDNRIILWNTETWEPVLELLGHESYVYRLAWSPDGTQIASASGDHTVRLWDSVSRSVRHRQLLDARLARKAVRPKVEAVWAESTHPEAAATAVVEGAMFNVEERGVAERVLLEMRLKGKARSR